MNIERSIYALMTILALTLAQPSSAHTEEQVEIAQAGEEEDAPRTKRGMKSKAKKRVGKQVAEDFGFKTEGYRYGLAGCGLGSLVFQPGEPQILAATTNGTSYSQFFGITFGTSNCNAPDEAAMRLEQQIFVEVNLATLSKEAAQGDGEALRAFAELLGCSDRYDAFAAIGRNHHGTIFDSNEPELVLQDFRLKVASAPELSGSCSRARS